VWTAAELDGLIQQATVDAYGESEQTTGFFTMMEQELALPFTVEILGAAAEVIEIDLDDGERIVAMCRRGGATQRMSLLDLPTPTSPPEGYEWVAAYRRWSR